MTDEMTVKQQNPWNAPAQPDPALAVAKQQEQVEALDEVVKLFMSKVARLRRQRARVMHLARNQQTIMAFQRTELAATKNDLVNLRRELEAARATVATLEATLAAERALLDDMAASDNASEQAAQNDLALARQELLVLREEVRRLRAVAKTSDGTPNLDAVVDQVVSELRKHGTGLYLGELQRMVRDGNLNRALAQGVKAGALVKRSNSNYYTLPEYAARSKASEAAGASTEAGESLGGLPLLNPRAEKKPNFTPPVRKTAS